jgi:LuxR family transcriptional regulator, maltose regulon positive regulatory protein
VFSPVLATKLYILPARPNRVSRPRLIEPLNSTKPLTLIVAPAGFGKTTLLSEWIPQSRQGVTWLSLDEDDNDLIRFWTYVVAALQKLQLDFGESALALLQSPQPPPMTTVLSMLINEIASFRDRVCLILDDYHLIKTQSIHQALIFLLDHLPEQMHLILTARADPPLPIARLRARNQLNELRAADLRFTREEAAFFLNKVMGLTLSVDEIMALESRTEGWAAGLQLAALSMQGREDVSEFIEAFSGSHKHVLTYLAEEVLERRPEGTLNFLLQTSILDRLCGSLCDAVNGRSDGASVLKKLEQANLFIVPLDDNGQWFRYHHLFADLLRNRLHENYPDQLAKLHLNASQWYEQAGLPGPAVQHALAAQAFNWAATLIEQAAPAMIQRSELARLLAWLECIPEDELLARPRLALYYGWGLLLSGKIQPAAVRLQAIEDVLAKDEAKNTIEVQAHIAAMRARLLRERGDLTSTVALSRQGLAQLSNQDAMLRPRITLDLTIAHYLLGEFEPALQLLTETIASGQTVQKLLSTLSAIYLKTQILRAQGALGEALQLCEEELELITQRGWHIFPAAGFLYVALGDLLRERNELITAAKYLEMGINLGQEGGNPYVSIAGCTWLAWLQQTQGNVIGSHQSIRTALQLVQEKQVSRFWPLPLPSCYQARLWIAQGNLAAAAHWAEATGLNPANPPAAYLDEVEYLTLARLLIAQCNLEAAENLLSGLHQSAVSAGRNGSLIEILMLQAITFAAQENNEEAFDALDGALTLAEPEGYIRVFVDEGEAVREMISTFPKKHLNHPRQMYIEKLLAAFEAPEALLPAATSQRSVNQKLFEPLSARELEVSRLIAQGLSNQAIAQKLFLSTGTVKVHLKHIFGKLDVNSRTQAVARLRELNLL